MFNQPVDSSELADRRTLIEAFTLEKFCFSISQMGTAASTSICGAGMILNSPRPNAASAAAAAADSVMPSVEAKPEVVRPPLTAHSTPHKQHLDGWSNAVEKMDHDNRIRVKIGLVINDR